MLPNPDPPPATPSVADQPHGPRHRAIPEGDDRERLICPDCGYIAYDNPKVVAGTVIAREGKLLLCRRSIHPRKGYWTIPAGFLEHGETAAEGAMREAWEEARARIEIDALLALYSLPRIGQIQTLFRGRLTGPEPEPGPETQELAFVAYEDIPWRHLAFPSVVWVLRTWHARQGESGFSPALDPDDGGIELEGWPAGRD